jgi:FdhD protein
MRCEATTDATLPAALRRTTVTRLQADLVLDGIDTVAEETPVALVFNGISHAVMMATPLALEDFGLGFALSEGILTAGRECRDIEIVAGHTGVEVRMTIAPRAMAALKERRRALEGRTGCGLCGIDSLEALDLQPPRITPQPAPSLAIVTRAFDDLPNWQRLHQQSGACHAAAWATLDGEIMVVREDVGRHNALDKLIGHLATAAHGHGPGFVLLSSRASYELVAKCARAQIGTLATVSAPTGLAIRVAQRAGVTLLGFCRNGRAVDYTASASREAVLAAIEPDLRAIA